MNKKRIKELENKNAELRHALASVLMMFIYPDHHGMRLFYATDGTNHREETLEKARAALKKIEKQS